jgi:hypothetical protein
MKGAPALPEGQSLSFPDSPKGKKGRKKKRKKANWIERPYGNEFDLSQRIPDAVGRESLRVN